MDYLLSDDEKEALDIVFNQLKDSPKGNIAAINVHRSEYFRWQLDGICDFRDQGLTKDEVVEKIIFKPPESNPFS